MLRYEWSRNTSRGWLQPKAGNGEDGLEPKWAGSDQAFLEELIAWTEGERRSNTYRILRGDDVIWEWNRDSGEKPPPLAESPKGHARRYRVFR